MRERSTFIHSKRQRPEKKEKDWQYVIANLSIKAFLKAFKSGTNFAIEKKCNTILIASIEGSPQTTISNPQVIFYDSQIPIRNISIE